MYRDLQNTYLKQKQKTLSSKAKPNAPKRYVTMDKQRSQETQGSGRDVRGDDQGLYEMEEPEGGASYAD